MDVEIEDKIITIDRNTFSFSIKFKDTSFVLGYDDTPKWFELILDKYNSFMYLHENGLKINSNFYEYGSLISKDSLLGDKIIIDKRGKYSDSYFINLKAIEISNSIGNNMPHKQRRRFCEKEADKLIALQDKKFLIKEFNELYDCMNQIKG